MTPTEIAVQKIDLLLDTKNRIKLNNWEINFLQNCRDVARKKTLTMKQKQVIHSIAKNL